MFDDEMPSNLDDDQFKDLINGHWSDQLGSGFFDPSSTTQQEQQTQEPGEEASPATAPLINEESDSQPFATGIKFNHETVQYPELIDNSASTNGPSPLANPYVRHQPPNSTAPSVYDHVRLNVVGEDSLHPAQNGEISHGSSSVLMRPSLTYYNEDLVNRSDCISRASKSAEITSDGSSPHQTMGNSSNYAWAPSSDLHLTHPANLPGSMRELNHNHSKHPSNATVQSQYSELAFNVHGEPAESRFQVPGSSIFQPCYHMAGTTAAAPNLMFSPGATTQSALDIDGPFLANAISATVPFDSRFSSGEEALEYINALPRTETEWLDVENDDWHLIQGIVYRQVCENLFAAIQLPPAPAPDNFAEDAKSYYVDGQNRIFEKCKTLLESEEKVLLASARVMVAITRVIKFHQYGVPSVDRQKLITGHSKAAFEIAKNLTCSARLGLIIEEARASKYVACDILSGKDISDFLLSPQKYSQRKRNNAGSNAKRKNNLQVLKQTAEEENYNRAHNDQDGSIRSKGKRPGEDTITMASSEDPQNYQRSSKKTKFE